MFFNSLATIQQAAAEALQQANITNLPPQMPNICAQSQSWAYQTIVSELAAKGYTLAQIQGWDAGKDYELNLALWAIFRRNAAMQGVEERTIGMFDVRKDLKELPGLVSGGVFQYPQGDAGTVGIGDLDTSDDIFRISPSEPNDCSDFISRTGERGDSTVL